MPQMTSKVQVNTPLWGAAWRRRVEAFTTETARASVTGMNIANKVTQDQVPRRRPGAPPRLGRAGTLRNLRWKTMTGGVEFDMAQADRAAPWWIVQEIGTGKRATIGAGKTTFGRSVRSQKGRLIPNSLAWSTAPGGTYSAPRSHERGAPSNEQLQLAINLRGVPNLAGRRLFIRNEIPAQHFVKQGADKGFGGYRRSVLSAARAAFNRPGRF